MAGHYTYKGVERTVAQVSRETGIPLRTLYDRMRREGVDLDAAVARGMPTPRVGGSPMFHFYNGRYYSYATIMRLENISLDSARKRVARYRKSRSYEVEKEVAGVVDDSVSIDYHNTEGATEFLPLEAPFEMTAPDYHPPLSHPLSHPLSEKEGDEDDEDDEDDDIPVVIEDRRTPRGDPVPGLEDGLTPPQPL